MPPGRHWGSSCNECGHDRDMHNLDGALGKCRRRGCDCGGYLELLHDHTERLTDNEDVVVEVKRRHRHHNGWKETAT